MNYKIGQIVRCGQGSTNLMRVESVSRKHGGTHDRYYGVQFYGGTVGAYEPDIRPATDSEIMLFETSPHVGRLRDYGDRLNPPEHTRFVDS
jgi:hypothetical protein